MTDTIISFTTIPPRMDRIAPVVERLRAQTAKIDGIILWVPKSYRRPEFRDAPPPPPMPGVDIRVAEEDFGPATKVLPAVEAFQGQDVRIIYCDDDEIYEDGWAQKLIDGSDAHNDEAVCINGLSVAMVEHSAYIHNLRLRALDLATFGVFGRRFGRRRAKRPGIGPVEIAQGFGGVLVRPDFFGPEVYEIPDVLWTVDDIWLSGHLATRGVNIRRISDRKMCEKSDLAHVASLTNYSFAGHDRIAADYKCVEYFRRHYNIWN